MKKKISEEKINNKAIDFIIQELKGGNSFSKFILQNILNKKFDIYSLIPQDIDKQKYYAFNEGGLGETNIEEYFISYLEKLLKNNNNLILIFEDPVVKKNDPFLKRSGLKNFFTFNDEVYFFTKSSDANNKHILEILKIIHGYPLIIYLLTIEEKLYSELKRGYIEENNLSLMTNYILEIYVGAYDNESFLRVKII